MRSGSRTKLGAKKPSCKREEPRQVQRRRGSFQEEERVSNQLRDSCRKERTQWNFSFKDWGFCLYTRDVNLQQSLQGETDGSSFRSSVPDTALNCSIIMGGAFRKSSTQHVLIEHPLQIRHCCRNWEYICE